FLQPTGSIRIGRIGNEFIIQPTQAQLEESDLDLIVAGTRTAVTMIEGFARELSETVMGDAVMFAHQQVVKVIDLIEQLRSAFGLPAKEAPEAAPVNPLKELFYQRFADEFRVRKTTSGKHERADKIKEMRERIEAEFLTPTEDKSDPPYVPEH